MSKEPPVKKFRAGSVEAAVWKHEQADEEGKTMVQHSVTFQKSYRDKNGDWKHGESFFPSDLPKLVLVAQKAFEFTTLS